MEGLGAVYRRWGRRRVEDWRREQRTESRRRSSRRQGSGQMRQLVGGKSEATQAMAMRTKILRGSHRLGPLLVWEPGETHRSSLPTRQAQWQQCCHCAPSTPAGSALLRSLSMSSLGLTAHMK